MIADIMKSDKRKRDYPQAKSLYDSGMSIGEIAQFYGRTRQAMWQWMTARNIKMRSKIKFGSQNHFWRKGKTASDKAQNILEKAIQKGIVIRQLFCESCGHRGQFKDGRTAIQAHHSDYNHPLQVMWLCQICHHNWHKQFKAKERR